MYKLPARTKLPESLRDWYSPEYKEKTHEEPSAISNKLLESLTVSDEMNNYVQKITCKQSESPKPAESLIKKICKKSIVCHTTVPSLKWGIENEKKALHDAHVRHEENHSNFSISFSGIQLHPKHPYIGASPDAIFILKEAANDKSFCLDCELNLKQGHKYYIQIQIQLFVFDLQECEFIVWTPQWMHREIVSYNGEFIKNSIPVIEQFFKRYIIAELLIRRLENKDELPVPTRKHYCVCISEYTYSSETWIGCDSKNCKGEWFHYKCVGVKRPPKGCWYWPSCKKSKGKKRKHKEK
ncbi:Inhibitor of growth 5 [Paramuricea clavata]|uniref:Inhibitor of growth 5, partial n=1 Tax=Paramuricea clavata TaxID=317549 RepID=A0A6S7HDR0_PARCT|nr:Inhibitor of growth 5 [Paramuricea clavata]